MRREGTRIAPAVLLVFSIGFTNLAYAEGNNPRPLSDNCQKASEASGSVIMSMWKILCRQEYENDREFNSLKRLANSLVGRDPSDFGTKEPPKKSRRVERPPSTAAKKPAKVKGVKAHKLGVDGFASSDKPHSKGVGSRREPARRAKHRAPSTASIHHAYFIGQKLSDLSDSDRRELRSKLESLMTRRDVNRVLDWIQKREGGGLVVVVGGISGKSKTCRQLIRKLNTSGHPKEQGLPNKCFLTTKHGLSTAAGKYQIVYYRNWRTLSKLLNLKDFSAKSQGIAALELMRTSKVKGGKLGEGFVALVRGDVAKALRKGTDPWAGSPYSRWYGGASQTQSARRNLRKLKNEKQARQRAAGHAHHTDS